MDIIEQGGDFCCYGEPEIPDSIKETLVDLETLKEWSIVSEAVQCHKIQDKEKQEKIREEEEGSEGFCFCLLSYLV